jgi:NAD(P)-dependent dehydrogenase (short-subunit alcohol dehydrogenase family)
MQRTVVVTGSASGIGAAVRHRLAAESLRVVGVDLHDAEIVADLSTRLGRTGCVEAIKETVQGGLDGLVACAGLGPQVRPVEMIVRVNFFGVVDVLDGLLPTLAAGTSPSAVVISSNSAGIIPPHAGLLEEMLAGDEEASAATASALDGATVYGMSKLALARAVRRRAGSWGEAGVRLNAVAPGPVLTPLLQGSLEDPTLGPLVDALPVPLGRRADPSEIAQAVGFLIDPANAYIHGSVLFVDGGTDALLRPDSI